MRLDQYLVEYGYSQSRNKAQELIKKGLVRVDGEIIRKTSLDVQERQDIVVEEAKQYVSRAGDKLAGFLENGTYAIVGKNCLDIGSSTGGFVEVLLSHGAASVTAVDVGTDQLHERLRGDARINLFEQTDIRSFTCNEPFAVVTCDVSFIGITEMLSVLDPFVGDVIILLFKPQFEVGKDVKRSSKGVVKDDAAIERAKARLETTAYTLGWELLESKDSIVKGKEGNAETFYAFKKRRD